MSIIIIVSISFSLYTAIAEIDLSGMSYNELVELKDRINKAIWDSEEWQEVTVPQGVYLAGEDIPVGHWTIEACDGAASQVTIGTKLKANGKEVEYSFDDKRYYCETIVSPTRFTYEEGEDRAFFDFELIEGDYVEVSNGDVIFTPYSGKTSLGFK
jgi:hypothetical protein